MDKCIIFLKDIRGGDIVDEILKLKDSEIESVSQLGLYKNIIVKQIKTPKKISFCLHCVLYDKENRITVNYGIYFETGSVVFTEKQKLFDFECALNYYENFLKTRNFELKSMEFFNVRQREI